ncbi:MAG: peptidylprolyl isomerase [Bacteroidales bacterium]|nr:peptidylprolyl isomerase [Bacteroidales bacterium]
MKKVAFLMIFFASIGVLSAQTADSQRTNPSAATYVKIETSYGDMVVWLYADTPLHRDNFLKLAEEGFYDSLLFHRVIKDFMIQGGDPESRHAEPGKILGGGSPGYTIPAEFRASHFHKKGALAAARQGDEVNPLKASSGSQFYIVQGNVLDERMLQMFEQRYGRSFTAEQRRTYMTIGGTPHLDGEYTVFGEVIDGLEVIDKIAAAECGRYDRPKKDIRMKITVLNR